jgi:hypothetical protein
MKVTTPVNARPAWHSAAFLIVLAIAELSLIEFVGEAISLMQPIIQLVSAL